MDSIRHVKTGDKDIILIDMTHILNKIDQNEYDRHMYGFNPVCLGNVRKVAFHETGTRSLYQFHKNLILLKGANINKWRVKL